MKFGINTVLWVWPFDNSNLDLLKKVKKIGYDTVEIAIEDMSDKNLKEIKYSLEENNLNCIICGNFSPQRSIVSEDKNIQKSGKDYLRHLIDICVFLDSKIIVGPTYSVGINSELLTQNNRKNAWNNCVQNLKEIGKYANENDVKIAVEPLNRYETNFINTSEEAVNLIKEIDNKNIGVQLDVYHMNIEEKNLSASIISTGKYLFHLHVPEHDRGTPGTGHTDWKGVADALKNISFKEAVVIESCAPEVKNIAMPAGIWRQYDYNQENLAIKGLDFLKKIMQ